MRTKFRMSVCFSYCLLVMLLILPLAALGQSDVGSISGFVRDKSGAVIPNATVIVRNEGTNEAHTVTTDSGGHFAVTNLPPATYSLTAEATGFNKFVSVHNPLPASTALAIDGTLEPGSVSQTVQVTASALVLQTESGSVQSEISGKTITDQQLNGRNPLFIGSLLPGMRSGTTLGDFNFAIGSSVPFNVNGARQQDTLVTFDGAPGVRTRGSGQIIGVASPDAVEEMQILTSDYQAEYGSSAGGQMRIVSKSGTTNFHATGYEYLRNSAMNANTWQRNQSATTRFASPFRYNNFGFTFGGPVYIPGVKWTEKFRQKLFFFVSEDWIRYRYTDTQTQAVPTTLCARVTSANCLPAIPGIQAQPSSTTQPRARSTRLPDASSFRTTPSLCSIRARMAWRSSMPIRHRRLATSMARKTGSPRLLILSISASSPSASTSLSMITTTSRSAGRT